MKKRLYIAMAALAAGTMLTVGCAKKSTEWVMANTTPVLDRPEAPDWVRGLTPKSDSRIYFVGRSDDGITCLSERDAIQSARNDIYDQVRQRLTPRDVGRVSQNAKMLTDSVSTDIGTTDDDPYEDRMGRDLNVFTVRLDSVMPALLSQLQEETVYLQEVLRTEAAKRNSRSTSREWKATVVKGHKAWLLCSIPRAEFLTIANDFRERYEQLYDVTLEWSIEDRIRRIDLETASQRAEFERQAEERAWNREDEIITRDHTITLDKDRHPMPGRRFGVVGSQ